jgi:pilus assembly protein TadC
MLSVLVSALAAAAVLLWPGGSARGGAGRRFLDGHAPRTPTPAPRSAPATAHTVADALLLVSLVLRSGRGPREAVERVAAVSDGATALHLRTVAAALAWGLPVAEAWRYAPEVWRPAALAWQVAESAGSGPAQLVEEASWRLREAEDRRLEAAAARAGVRLVLPLGLAFLPAFACTTVIPVVLALARRVLDA